MPHTPDAPAPGAFADDPGFQLLARALPDALFAVDAEGAITFASDRTEAMLGLAPEAVVGSLFRDLVHPDDRATLPEPFSALLGGAWDARFLVDGEPRWGNFSLLEPGLPLAEGTVFVLVRLLDAEFAPRDRTTLYREALDATNNLVVVTDPQLPDNPIVFVNANFLKATGYERDEIVGRNCRFLQFRPDGTRDDDQPGFNGLPGLAALREAIESGTDARVALRNYRKNGEVFYNELYLTAIRDAEGKAVAFIGVQNDITEKVEARNQIANQEKLLGAFYEGASLGMGIVALDHEDNVVHRSANPAALALFDTDTIHGATPEALGFPGEEAALWRRHFRECCDTGESVVFETQYPWGRASGEMQLRQLRIIVSPMGGTDECTCAYVMEDRTDVVSVEQERRRLYAAVESLPDPVLITDARLDRPGPHIVYVNPAFTEVFGYSADEVIGENPRMFQGPATDPTVLARLRRRLEMGQPFRGEAVNYKKDGTPFLMEWEIAPIENDRGELAHYVSTMRDVTGRRRLERAVFEATAREQERMARDLHDGLGQVLAGTRYALSASANALGDEAHSEASTVQKAADRIGQALDQARSIAHGLLPTHLEDNDLPHALSGLAREVSHAYGISCSASGDLEVRPASRTHHLYRIAQEAATNAVRHGHAQNVTITLALCEDHGYGACLSIRDDGIGIHPSSGGHDGVGMRSMRFRAQTIGGMLSVEAGEHGGTVVTCRFDADSDPVDGAADLARVQGLD